MKINNPHKDRVNKLLKYFWDKYCFSDYLKSFCYINKEGLLEPKLRENLKDKEVIELYFNLDKDYKSENI